MIHKTGDSFDFLAVIPSTFDNAYFVGWTVKSQIRTVQYASLIAELTCTWVDPTITRTLKILSIDTKSWPVGNAIMDIQFTRDVDGYTISTDTISVDIVKDVTRYE